LKINIGRLKHWGTDWITGTLGQPSGQRVGRN